MPVSSSPAVDPDEPAARSRSVVMPHSMIVNGSVITSGGSFIAGSGAAVDERVDDLPAARSISAGQ